MPEIRFGKKDEKDSVVSLKESDNLLVVRTRSTRSLKSGPVLSPAAEGLEGGELVLAFPEAGVEVYQVRSATRSLTERKKALLASQDVRFAGGVLVNEASGEPVIYTENIFIKFVNEADPNYCRQVIQEVGLTIKKEISFAPNSFFVGAPEGTGIKVFDIALKLLERKDVEYCHPEVVQKRSFKTIAPQQWHLKAALINSVQIQANSNVEAAHKITQGKGVTIAIIDDGIDVDHPEFNRSGKVVAPRDETIKTDDPRPKDLGFTDDHGTACAGVACASGLFGASGVAPQANLMPIRLASGLGSIDEANAFIWAVDNGADIISCSWGPSDGAWFDLADPLHNRKTPISSFAAKAIDYAVTKGRDGKGCIVLFAAGNGNEKVDLDGYASYDKVIAVAACNDSGKRSVYSDFGKAIWCSFPSSDFGHVPFNHPDPLTPGIWTTDRVGASGYNPGRPNMGDVDGDYTNSFGGTSSACPGAAGVAALILSVNPKLRWHEVRDIMRKCCDKIDPQSGKYDANGHSVFYGFGRLNAEKAVQLAIPSNGTRISVARQLSQPTLTNRAIKIPLRVSETTPIANLSVEVKVQHPSVKDLAFSLVSPKGKKILLMDDSNASNPGLNQLFDEYNTPSLKLLQGTSMKGTWSFLLEDKLGNNPVTFIRCGLHIGIQ